MAQLRIWLINLFFFALCTGLFLFSLSFEFTPSGTEDGPQGPPGAASESYFSDLIYFRQDDQGPLLNLTAKALTRIQSSQLLSFLLPVGRMFPKHSPPVDFKSIKGHLNLHNEVLSLYGSAEMEDKDSFVKAERIFYRYHKDDFEGFESVRTQNIDPESGDQIFVASNYVLAHPQRKWAHYKGDVRGFVQKQRRYEEGVKFRAQEMVADFSRNYIELINKVYLQQNSMEATARRGELFLDNYSKKLKYYHLYDDVVLKESFYNQEGQLIHRTAYGEKLDGHGQERKVILRGFPRVLQGKETIRGNQITLFQSNETIEVDDAKASLLIK